MPRPSLKRDSKPTSERRTTNQIRPDPVNHNARRVSSRLLEVTFWVDPVAWIKNWRRDQAQVNTLKTLRRASYWCLDNTNRLA